MDIVIGCAVITAVFTVFIAVATVWLIYESRALRKQRQRKFWDWL